jgi:hypothetical protein
MNTDRPFFRYVIMIRRRPDRNGFINPGKE